MKFKLVVARSTTTGTIDAANSHIPTQGKLAMLTRSALFAIAASALSLTALTPTDASARPGGGIGNHARFVNNHPRIARFVHNHPRAARFIHNHPRLFIRRHVLLRSQFVHHHWRWGWRPGHFCWRHPWYCRTQFGAYPVRAVPVIGAAPAIAAPVAPVIPAVPYGRCLTQTRLADGNSLFRNVCTNEAAITNAPESEQPPLK
jgi:hypothetical protein